MNKQPDKLTRLVEELKEISGPKKTPSEILVTLNAPQKIMKRGFFVDSHVLVELVARLADLPIKSRFEK